MSIANSSICMMEDAMGCSSTQTTFIDDLPDEVLLEILRNVESSDLLKCRLTNWKWNELSSQLMCKRADVQLKFDFKEGRFVRSIKYRFCEELLIDLCRDFEKLDTKQTLTNLIDCIEKSQHFPCKNFRFDTLDNFEKEEMNNFLSIWGKKILTLSVSINDPNHYGILRDLLVHKVVNLRKLELLFQMEKDQQQVPDEFIQRFSTVTEIQLPNLKILSCDQRYRRCRGIVENILANNLEEFELTIFTSRIVIQMSPDYVHHRVLHDPRSSIKIEDLIMLQKFNKLNCLKNIHVHLAEDLINYWTHSPTYFAMKLHALSLNFERSVMSDQQLKPRIALIINQLLHTSMSTIQSLSVQALGWLPGVVIPKCEKLRKLGVCGYTSVKSENETFFPPLFEIVDHFPNLKELDMHLTNERNFQRPLKTIPSVKVLRLIGSSTTEINRRLMQATPNVETLVMAQDEFPMYRSPHPIGIRLVPENLPNLKVLCVMICSISYRDLFHEFDAEVTGFSTKFCSEMSKKFAYKDGLADDEVAAFQPQRQNPSIVDLKELNRFDISLFFDSDAYVDMTMGDEGAHNSDCEDSHCVGECVGAYRQGNVDESGFSYESQLFQTGVSKVSKFLAFDLMPELKIRVHKRME